MQDQGRTARVSTEKGKEFQLELNVDLDVTWQDKVHHLHEFHATLMDTLEQVVPVRQSAVPRIDGAIIRTMGVIRIRSESRVPDARERARDREHRRGMIFISMTRVEQMLSHTCHSPCPPVVNDRWARARPRRPRGL